MVVYGDKGCFVFDFFMCRGLCHSIGPSGVHPNAAVQLDVHSRDNPQPPLCIKKQVFDISRLKGGNAQPRKILPLTAHMDVSSSCRTQCQHPLLNINKLLFKRRLPWCRQNLELSENATQQVDVMMFSPQTREACRLMNRIIISRNIRTRQLHRRHTNKLRTVSAHSHMLRMAPGTYKSIDHRFLYMCIGLVLRCTISCAKYCSLF